MKKPEKPAADVKKPDGDKKPTADAKKPTPPFGPPGFRGFGPGGFGRGFDPAHEKEMRERFEKMRAEWERRRDGDRSKPTTSESKADEVAKRLDRLADEVAELKKLLKK